MARAKQRADPNRVLAATILNPELALSTEAQA